MSARPPTVAEIIHATAIEYGVSRVDILGKSRFATIAAARHVAIYLCRKLRGMSLPELGREFDQRGHHTAMHSVHKIEGDIVSDVRLAHRVARIEARVHLEDEIRPRPIAVVADVPGLYAPGQERAS